VTKVSVFWDVDPYNLPETEQHFKGAFRLRHQGYDDWGSRRLWNFSQHLPDYTTQQPKRQPTAVPGISPSYSTTDKTHLRKLFNKDGSLRHKNETRSHYNVKCSSFIPLKHHYFSELSQSTLMHLSHLGTSLKIPSRHKSRCCISNIHRQPFNFVTVESATAQVLLQTPKQMESNGARSGLQDYSIWLADLRHLLHVIYQVLPPNEKQNPWLTQKLQSGQPNLLNVPGTFFQALTTTGTFRCPTLRRCSILPFQQV
jgi:hypothetical protein